MRLAVSMGDPAGIGPEVVLKALGHGLQGRIEPVVVGCRSTLEATWMRLKALGVKGLVHPDQLIVHHIPVGETIHPGQPSAVSGDAGFQWLSAATSLVLAGDCQALTTAPIAKEYWYSAGHCYPGQTERLAELCDGAKVSMLFTARAPTGHWRLNTMLATTHIPLRDVPARLTPELVQWKLDALNRFSRRFQPHPKLAVAGLNPHAGEAGLLGTEEGNWLTPLLRDWQRSHPDTTVEGPRPPDTCWLDAGAAWRGEGQGPDGYLALYHDQGLIAVKMLAFDAAVNTTLGLPFIRTSPDHGTGFDIAGHGIARPASMAAAIDTALELGLRSA